MGGVRASTGIRRLALIRPDRIGDCVLASAVLPAVRRAYPEAEIVWFVRREVAPLFSGPEFPVTLHAYDAFAGPDVLAAVLSARAFDAVVLLEPNPVTDRAALLAGVPVRIGFDSSVPGALTHRCSVVKRDGSRHEWEACLAAVAMLPGFVMPAGISGRPCLSPATAGGSATTASLSGGYHVIHPGAHGNKARVPAAVWVAVAERLFAETGRPSVLVGGDRSDVFPVTPAIAKDFRGETDLATTARLLAGAALVFSRDSGPAHVAAALGAPTVCVFMENTPSMGPRRWSPLGPRVAVLTPEAPRWYDRFYFAGYRRRVVASISAERILEAARGLSGV